MVLASMVLRARYQHHMVPRPRLVNVVAIYHIMRYQTRRLFMPASATPYYVNNALTYVN